ncbi:MAG: esterase [Acidimicrobiaceae bacterium]|nr:esterase [Acidimicrobiaceae bacterium]
MAHLTCRVFSDTLGLASEATVIVPEAEPPPHGWPTLYLLHGLSDDHSTWTRRTSIERYVEELPLAVVMPSAHRSWYTDQVEGYRYGTFVMEELPRLMRQLFRFSDRRQDNFAAGLSMGGYGALKWGLAHPDSMAAVASLSGATDLAAHWSTPESRRTFGDLSQLRKGGNDLFHLAEQASTDTLPAIYQWCGTEDHLYDENVRFRDHCQRLGLPITYEEAPGGHDWPYWDQMIQRVLEWLPMEPSA